MEAISVDGIRIAASGQQPDKYNFTRYGRNPVWQHKPCGIFYFPLLTIFDTIF